MSSTLKVGVGVGVLASLLLAAAGPVSAENEQHASITVRATGKSGSVTRTRRGGRQAVEAALPTQVDGGQIPRAALDAEVARGIGRFLQQVRVEPVVSRGRFVGWRIATLFPNRTDVHAQGLRAGDIVLRVNGHSLERPEDLVAFWQTLASATRLVVDIERAGEATTVQYTIK